MSSKRYSTKGLPTTGIFCAFPFLLEAFKKLKTFFCRKNTPHIFWFFHLKHFLSFLPKNLIIRAEKTFLKNNSIWYAYYNKCCHLKRFWKKNQVLSKKAHLFFKKPKFGRFRNLTNSIVAFYGKFATIWFKKSHVQERECCCCCKGHARDQRLQLPLLLDLSTIVEAPFLRYMGEHDWLFQYEFYIFCIGWMFHFLFLIYNRRGWGKIRF